MQFYGQAGQDLFVLSVLKNKLNGTFVEIGSNHPIVINNTYLLEKSYKWKGIMVEYNSSFLELYKKERPNSIHIISDATKVDFRKEFVSANLPHSIDYLQIDLEVTNNSTLQTLINIEQQVMSDYRFAVITFEHDVYSGNYFDTRNKSREIFSRNGYFRVFSDVSHVGNPYEDWYVDPSLVDMDFINRIKSDQSLGWTEILPKIWNTCITFSNQASSLGYVQRDPLLGKTGVQNTRGRREKVLIFDCENEHLFNCGLGDRLIGLLCTIVLSKILNRRLLINWKTPDISNFFDFAQWQLDFAQSDLKKEDIFTIDAGGNQKKVEKFFKEIDIDFLNKYEAINFVCNTNPLIYLFQNESFMLTIDDYNNLFNNAAKSLFTEYLKPIGKLNQLIEDYQFEFNKNEGPVVGLQIRTGDTHFHKNGNVQPFYPIEQKCQGIIDNIKNKLEFLGFDDKFRYRLFVTFDNPAVASIIDSNFDKKILYVDYPIGHFGLQRSETELLKQFGDMILLSKCHLLFVSHFSNFGRIPFMINDSDRKFTIAIKSDTDDFGYTLGLGKNDSSLTFKVYKPTLVDISCKHPDWKHFLHFLEKSAQKNNNFLEKSAQKSIPIELPFCSAFSEKAKSIYDESLSFTQPSETKYTNLPCEHFMNLSPPLAPNQDEVDIYTRFVKNNSFEKGCLLLGFTKELIHLADHAIDINPPQPIFNVEKGDWFDISTYYDVIIGDGCINMVGGHLVEHLSKWCGTLVIRFFTDRLQEMKYATRFRNNTPFLLPDEIIDTQDKCKILVWHFNNKK